jgi:ADP-heptose:LPS heptosyltransferase
MAKNKELVHIDCRYYRGYIPCIAHKRSGVHCSSCAQYDPVKERILIIKLGAAGDVIRTTPLLHKLKRDYPAAEITWLTNFPDLMSSEWVDNVLNFSLASLTWLKTQEFDWLINLDKDMEAIALAESIEAKRKTGFLMDGRGKCRPINSESETNKWLTGLWDDWNKSNKLSYLQEIFRICGYEFEGEEYILDFDKNDGLKKSIKVGLNTGCGERWPTRLWPDQNWLKLAKRLVGKGYNVFLLGGPQEDAKNQRLSQDSGAEYLGVKSLKEFCNLINDCDIIVTQVTMAMHIAIAAKKYLVLMNNIFNREEFHLYERGVIVEPEIECLGCFKQRYDDRCLIESCMSLISVESVEKAVQNAAKAEEAPSAFGN